MLKIGASFSNYKLTILALAFLSAVAFLQGVRPHRAEIPHTWNVIASSQLPYFKDDPANLLFGGHIWHAQTPPQYPEWVLVTLDQPRKINHLMIRAQPGSSGEFKRAPKDFVFQGSKDSTNWKDLLTVKEANYNHSGERQHWSVNNSATFRYYRIYITANNGDADFLTIWQIKLE